ncbi:MAG: hypothetical protein NTY68_01550 [Candidatus Micrarchaeota archaeon]|nr:hypothetical protein [Candidatus Micrarchaeota archaeon]
MNKKKVGGYAMISIGSILILITVSELLIGMEISTISGGLGIIFIIMGLLISCESLRWKK